MERDYLKRYIYIHKICKLQFIKEMRGCSENETKYVKREWNTWCTWYFHSWYPCSILFNNIKVILIFIVHVLIIDIHHHNLVLKGGKGGAWWKLWVSGGFFFRQILYYCICPLMQHMKFCVNVLSTRLNWLFQVS